MIDAAACNDERVALPGRPRERCLADPNYRAYFVREAIRIGRVDDATATAWGFDGASLVERGEPQPMKDRRRLPLEVLDARRAKCTPCPHNVAGVCLKLKEILPDRPCRIEAGVEMPHAYCPIEEWDTYPPRPQPSVN